MKQVLLFGVVLLLTAVIAGVIMRPKPQAENELGGPKPTAYFTLYKISGDVSYKKGEESAFVSLQAEKVFLPYASTVKTTDGKATVVLEDKSIITIKENTEIVVNYTEQGFSILQSFGKTYHRVKTLLQGKTYEVRTPTTLAAVRGTKFGVSNKEGENTTKISVTENKVGVRDVQATSTTETEETVVEEGKTATVEGGDKKEEVKVGSTKDEKEMSALIEEETILDEVYDSLSETDNDEDFKQKVEEIIDGIRKEEDKRTEDDNKNIPEIKKEETKTETKTEGTIKKTEPVTEDPKPVVNRDIKQVGEEAFFTEFEPLFIRLFYMDDALTPCKFTGSPDSRVKEISTFTASKGWPLESITNLTSFAKAIEEYCGGKRSPDLREGLQKRFDAEYPYQ